MDSVTLLITSVQAAAAITSMYPIYQDSMHIYHWDLFLMQPNSMY